ncbi:hypothetical protein CVT26_008485 [Gymnopilus dilepis]|uniref:Transmembrane protein n=1 Tax=Gymnopilus dilepis TaxID=231916 RepID=A0A409XXK2_9AGAR|nr:hypothetical protein CVT26_008485 [Gymnopilus dilepis]
MSLPHVDLNTTLGAMFAGHTVATALFGITSLQTFIFFRGNTRDQRWFKELIAFLWGLDFLHQVFMTHGVYDYLVLNFGDIRALSKPTWSLLSQVLTTCLSDLIVRCVFARRIWLLSGHNRVLLFFNVTASIFVFVNSTKAFSARAFIDMSFITLIRESWLLYAALGGSVLADGLVTASLCVLLSQQRTGFKSTADIASVLFKEHHEVSSNAGFAEQGLRNSLLRHICNMATPIRLYGDLLHLGQTSAPLPTPPAINKPTDPNQKVYINSLLAVLNTREALRRRNSGMTSIPQSPSSIEPLSMPFAIGTSLAEPESPDVAKPRPSKLTWRDNGWK